MNSVKFYHQIEVIKREKKDMSYMDAVVYYCEQNEIEIETVGKFISKTLREEENKIFIVVSKQTVKAIKCNPDFKNIKKCSFIVVGKQTSLALKKIGINVKLKAVNSSDLISKIKKRSKKRLIFIFS